VKNAVVRRPLGNTKIDRKRDLTVALAQANGSAGCHHAVLVVSVETVLLMSGIIRVYSYVL
jgi:hypothetical protein